jgi:hypothetical protein
MGLAIAMDEIVKKRRRYLDITGFPDSNQVMAEGVGILDVLGNMGSKNKIELGILKLGKISGNHKREPFGRVELGVIDDIAGMRRRFNGGTSATIIQNLRILPFS